MVEPAKEQNKRSAHDGRGSFTKYMMLSEGGGGEGRGSLIMCHTSSDGGIR